ncbi:GINS complex subunit [Elasticomyces elasticus]|nr:GINS complex subunit [Elasticomyces elasticus]
MDIDDILASVSAPRIPQRTLDLQALSRAWVAERVAPELLPYPTDLIDRVMDRIRKQIELVEEMTGNMDPKSNFNLIVVQTELERFKFLIDKHALHYFSLAKSQSSLLSQSETQYLHHHASLLSSHYNASFLSSFPQNLQRLDDTAGGISMIDQPDEDTAVFCRILRDAGTIEVHGEQGSGEVELRRGDVWVVRWSAVKDSTKRGDVELI